MGHETEHQADGAAFLRPPASAFDARWKHLGTILMEQGLLDPDQLRAAFAEQIETGRRLGDIALERGWLTEEQLASALAEQYGMQFCDLREHQVDPAVALLLREQVVRANRALPIQYLDDGSLLVGVVDPSNLSLLDNIKIALDQNVTFCVVLGDDFEAEVRRLFRADVEIDEQDEPDYEPDTVEREEVLEASATIPAVRLVNSALGNAIADGASDIHFEPEEDRLAVRARIDGMMREVASIPKAMQAGVLGRLKIMGNLDIAERRAPQDGRLFIRLAGDPIDLRIAVLPTSHGEQIVLRVQQRAAGDMSLSELGMSPDAEHLFRRALAQPYGALIVCGPTGSGKTTTLYAALHLANEPTRVVMTIEDPVEREIRGVGQIEVRTKSGLTFARGLRTILRSDPDVLLVGEVRDDETARIAVQAAMTGHLVLTSLHAHDAASSIARLTEMGVEPGLLAASVNCIVAQRLARRLCTDCRIPYAATGKELGDPTLGVGDDQPITLYRAGQCARCSGSGYRGRVALYEVLLMQERLRPLMHCSTQEIAAAAVENGMRTLRQDGLRLCISGVSSLEEITRVTGERH